MTAAEDAEYDAEHVDLPPPPSELDLEVKVLAAMLHSADATETVRASGLAAEDFYSPRNQATFLALMRARDAGHEVCDGDGPNYAVLAHHGLTDRGTVRDLVAGHVGHANVATWVDLIVSAATRRTVERISSEVGEAARLGLDYGPAVARLAGLDPRGTKARPRLPGVGMADLLDTDLTLRWLVRGLLCSPTYGQIAGELKTLKSHLSTILAACVASGEPFLGQFPIEQPAPVTVLVGEGGRIPFVRRLTAITNALGIDDPRELPLRAVFEVAPIGTDKFHATIDDELDQGAGLVILDPLYAYHGTTVDSRNLHEEGSLLTSLSNPCAEAGASLLVVNHYNQTGTGTGLKRITQAGSGEWVDSWLLTSHRHDPNVAAGEFHLRLDAGSRQWGGSSWDVDLNLGALDPATGQHHGHITWDARPADRTATATQAADDRRQRVLDAVAEHPGRYVREDLARAAGGQLKGARQVVDTLEAEGLIASQIGTRAGRDGRQITSRLFHPASDPGTPQDVGGDL